MRLLSKVSPVYYPESDQTSVLRLGLNKLAPHEWLVVDEDFSQFYRNKLQCREFHRDKVFQALPGSEAAQRELQNLVIDHLTNDHSNSYQVLSGSINHTPSDSRWSLDNESLWHTSLWIQEDLCLMELRDDEYYLTAASVCAPSNWALEGKIGRSLDDIHNPVPGYARELSRRTNRLFARLKPDRPLLRFNWSVQNTAELFWRKDLAQENLEEEGREEEGREEEGREEEGREEEGREEERREELHWRVERQTLRRLPESGAIVFTIRIFIHSFSAMGKGGDFPSKWQKLIGQLRCDQKKYKGLLNIPKAEKDGQ